MKKYCDLCKRKAVHEIRRIVGGTWLSVCGWHDSYIGKENLIMLGYSKEEAAKINNEVRKGA